MQVENIECQIAQAQIGNFLAGSGLSEEAMQQLEDHIAGCVHCKGVLNERRNELRAMLTGERAVVDFEKIAREAEETKAKSIATALRKKSLQQMLEPTAELPFVHEPKKQAPLDQLRAIVEQSAPAAETPKKAAPAAQTAAKTAPKWKPLAYSLALAAVLVGMSLFSNNIAAIFGPKANESSKVLASNGNANTNSNPANTTPNSEIKPEVAPVAVPTDTKTEGSNPTEVTTGTDAANTTSSVAPEAVTPVEGKSAGTPPIADAPPQEETESTVALALGASAGALSTTQFESVVEEPTPVQKPTPTAPAKPTVSTPKVAITRKPIIRRAANRRIVKPRKVVARKPGVRSRGIKVYNP